MMSEFNLLDNLILESSITKTNNYIGLFSDEALINIKKEIDKEKETSVMNAIRKYQPHLMIFE